jgi:NADPH2:quinone reductase
MMQAVRINAVGGPEALSVEQIAKPVAAANGVVVEMKFAGINYIDTYQRSGLYKVPTPFTLGREGAGVVASVGADVTAYKAGDRVAFFAQGAYAEFIAVPAAALVRVPDGVTLHDAAGALLQGLTAHYLSHSTHACKEGDVVLVHAGAGGTGRLLSRSLSC